MDDSSPKLTVIATRMAYIDRRSLSQAWFSALHLASDGQPAVADRERRNVTGEIALPRRAATSAAEGSSPATGLSTATQGRGRVDDNVRANAEIATRRTYDARLAAAARMSYERARSYPPFRTTLTLEAKGGRVQLLLRREGATLHVVAICRPEIAETVRRALACADAHVRIRGEAIRSSIEIVSPNAKTA